MEKNKYYLGFVTVDYDEFNQQSFRAIEVHCKKTNEKKDDIKRFVNKDPLIAWFEYSKWLYSVFLPNNEIIALTKSSSVDDWFTDGEEYFERHFHPKTGKFLSIKGDKYHPDLEEYPTCVVNKSIHSFNELKRYCILHKK